MVDRSDLISNIQMAQKRVKESIEMANKKHMTASKVAMDAAKVHADLARTIAIALDKGL